MNVPLVFDWLVGNTPSDLGLSQNNAILWMNVQIVKEINDDKKINEIVERSLLFAVIVQKFYIPGTELSSSKPMA